jgi:ubiquinone biosynthesis accessory factor UbiJ
LNNVVDIAFERLLERAVARARVDSPRAIALLRALQDRTLAVRIVGSAFHIELESNGETLRRVGPGISASSSAPASTSVPDATIIGAPLSLLALAGEDPQAVIARGDVKIEGDAEIAQSFRELAMLMRPDLEAGLSRLLGRSGAHMAVRGLRAVGDWARATAWTATHNVAEYLAYERGDLVSRPEAEHFLRGVDQLREQLDRLDARLSQIELRAATLPGGISPSP